mgnify:CR=1 FL=1
MRRTSKRVISMIAVIALLVSSVGLSFSYATTGEEISFTPEQTMYMVKNDDFARSEPNDLAEKKYPVLKGQYLSASEVNRDWVVSEVAGEKLYTKKACLVRHNIHCWKTVLTGDGGVLKACKCGECRIDYPNGKRLSGDLVGTFEQMLLGNYSSAQTVAGIIGSIAIGWIPGLGTLADARDISADLLNCASGECEKETLVLDSTAIIPIVDFVKYAKKGRVLGKISQLDGDYLIGTYKELSKVSKGRSAYGIEIHHLIEKRLGVFFDVNRDDIISVALQKAEHQVYTRRWLREVPRCGKNCYITQKKMIKAVQKVYADEPELCNLAVQFINDHWAA